MRDDELIFFFFESFLFALIIPLSNTNIYISEEREDHAGSKWKFK
jgi:hypothetical protein